MADISAEQQNNKLNPKNLGYNNHRLPKINKNLFVYFGLCPKTVRTTGDMLKHKQEKGKYVFKITQQVISKVSRLKLPKIGLVVT